MYCVVAGCTVCARHARHVRHARDTPRRYALAHAGPRTHARATPVLPLGGTESYALLGHRVARSPACWHVRANACRPAPAPPADQLIKQAVSFINNPRVKHTSVEQKRAFLNGKGLSEAQVDEAFRLAAASKAASPPAQPHEASGAAAAPATTTTTTAVAERTSGNV